MRGESSSDQTYGYGGKPVSERQSDVDRLLVDQDAPEEQRILGTTVSFPDAFRFKGAAPEVINSRCAIMPVCRDVFKFSMLHAFCLLICSLALWFCSACK